MLGVWLLFAMTRPPCLPFELGQRGEETPPPEVVTAPAPPTAAPAPPPRAPVVAPALPPRAPPPPVAQNEHARYRIDYGVLAIGDLELTIGGVASGETFVSAHGRGEGAVLGLGRMDNRIVTRFDLTRLDSRRWVAARSGGERPLRDNVDQAAPGQVTFVRELLDGKGARVATNATLTAPLLDPLGFLLRLRVAPPVPGGPALVLFVLDGQALWRVTVTSAGRAPLPDGVGRVATLRLDAEALPIRYDGVVDADGDRRPRAFALWLSDDAARVPLRLQMPIGVADLVVALTEIERRDLPIR